MDLVSAETVDIMRARWINRIIVIININMPLLLQICQTEWRIISENFAKILNYNKNNEFV